MRTQPGPEAALSGRQGSRVDPENKNYLLLLILLTAAPGWLLPLSSSLWLDETGTYWVVKDGLRQAFDRSLRFQGQSPAYYLIEWVARRVGGRSEVALRMPSLLIMVVATYLVFLLGRRLADSELGLLSAVAFVSFGAGDFSVAFAAIDARPYAFAMAGAIASTLALVTWFDRGRRRDAAAYVVLAALTVYFHYLFAPVLLVHAAYILARRRRATVPVRDLLIASGALLLLLLPLAGQVHALFARREALSIPARPSFPVLAAYLAPSAFFLGLLGGVLVARLRGPMTMDRFGLGVPTSVLVVGTIVLPPVALFSLAYLGSASVFSPRYLLSVAPGFALAGGVVLRSLSPPRARRVAALTVALVALAATVDTTHQQEDWRGAAARANQIIAGSSIPVLFHAGLIESAQLSWIRDPGKRGFVDAPLALYPIHGRVYTLPYTLNDKTTAYFTRLVQEVVIPSDRFVLITRYPLLPFKAWLEGRLLAEGFTARDIGSFGNVTLSLFERESRTG